MLDARRTPLHMAAQGGRIGLVKELLGDEEPAAGYLLCPSLAGISTMSPAPHSAATSAGP